MGLAGAPPHACRVSSPRIMGPEVGIHKHLLCLQDQVVQSQEARWRQVCGATRIAAAWRGRQVRLRLQHLRAARQMAKRQKAASAIQVSRAEV